MKARLRIAQLDARRRGAARCRRRARCGSSAGGRQAARRAARRAPRPPGRPRGTSGRCGQRCVEARTGRTTSRHGVPRWAARRCGAAAAKVSGAVVRLSIGGPHGSDALACGPRARRDRGVVGSRRSTALGLIGVTLVRYAAIGPCRVSKPPLKTRRPNGVAKASRSRHERAAGRRGHEGETSDVPERTPQIGWLDPIGRPIRPARPGRPAARARARREHRRLIATAGDYALEVGAADLCIGELRGGLCPLAPELLSA